MDAKQQEITTRIMELNRNDEGEDSTSDESDWGSISDTSEMLDVPDDDAIAAALIEFLADDDDDDGWETLAEEESDVELEELGLEEEEIKECAYFLKYEETVDVDETIFTPDDLIEMKQRERVMMERNDRGYYRCKVKDKQLYDDIMSEYSRFITPDNLAMVHHVWSTQKNEAMNTSVAALAPKHKHYSMTISLKTRVGIAAACQVQGFAKFWSNVCTTLGFDIDANLLSKLTMRDEKKRRKKVSSSTLEGKRKRSRSKHGKINLEHKHQMAAKGENMVYETGIACRTAKKNIPSTKDRNAEGTPQHLLRCIYYHPTMDNACNVLGHLDCRNALCEMKPKSKEERKEVLQALEAVAVEEELKRMKILGEFSSFLFTQLIHTYIIVSHFRFLRLLVRAK